MHASKGNLAIGLSTLAVVALAIVLTLRGCESRGQVGLHVPAATPTRDPVQAVAVSIEPAPAAQPSPEQSARKGQIYFHHDLSLSKIIPGEGL